MPERDAQGTQRGGAWLPRERLVRRAQQALARRLVLMTAPWGAGKSSLLRDLAQRLDRSLVRVRMDANSVDLSFFFWQLLTALGHPSDGIPSDAESVIDPLAQVVERVAEQPPLVIALDNAEDLAGAGPVLEVVALFAERLPKGSSLLVASRMPLDLPSERLRARGELAVLGPEEFRVHEDELRTILARLAPAPSLAPHELDYLGAATEGRLLLVRLFAEATRSVPVPELLDRIGRRGIAEALVDAVLTDLHDSERRWLEDVSILEELRRPLVDHLTREPDRSEGWLAHASRLHLVEPFETPRRMPSLVHDLLRRRVAADPERWRALHARAAEFHRAEGDAEGAFHHLVEAGDVEQAVETLIGIGHASIHNRRLDALGRLLDRLDEAVVATNPVLRFTRGSLRWVQGHPSEALEDLRAVIPMVEGTDLARAARVRIAQIRTFQGSFREAAATLAPMLRGALDLADPLVVTACSSALVALVHLGREAEAQALLDRIGEEGVPEAQLINLRLGQCYAARLHGDSELQRRLGLEALAAGRRAGITGVLCFMPIHVAEGELGRGHAGAALELAEEAERASRTMREHWLELAAGEVRVRALQALGRHDEARATGRTVIAGCEVLGGAWTEAEVWLSLSRSPGEDRSTALASAAAAAARTDHADLEARIALERARQALDVDRAGEAEQHVEAAAGRLGDVRADATRFELGLVRARLARTRGDIESAREAVRSAGLAGRSFGIERTALMAELLREALAGEAWARAEIERAPRTALAHVPRTRSHRQAALRLHLLDLAARPLEVSSLGTLEVRLQARADEPEETLGFRTPRVLDLLLFLLVEGETRPVAVDALVEAFWGSAVAGAGSLRTHLTHLRRALEPHVPPGTPSRYLLRTPDGYRVDLRGGRFDVASFRREVAAARAFVRRDDVEQADAAFERALALCRGEFAPSRPYVEALAGERRRLALLFEQACLEGARVARARNAPAVARERLEALLEREPGHGEAYALLAEWARADGRTAELAVLAARRRAALADAESRE